MRRSSLDILEKSLLPGEQAKAILEVMDLELQSHREELATKDDLARLSLELRKELADRIHPLEIQIHSLRAEMARWILGSSGALIGAFGVMLGLLYFFMSRLVK